MRKLLVMTFSIYGWNMCLDMNGGRRINLDICIVYSCLVYQITTMERVLAWLKCKWHVSTVMGPLHRAFIMSSCKGVFGPRSNSVMAPVCEQGMWVEWRIIEETPIVSGPQSAQL